MSRPSLSTRLGALSGAAVLSLGLVACATQPKSPPSSPQASSTPRQPAKSSSASETGQKTVEANPPTMASTAMGRAYLFSLPDVDRNKQIDAIRRRWRDDWTKVKTGLERSFKELTDRGFCVTWGEWLPELCGVGAPLRNSDGTAAYAINASAPIYQISRDRLEADWGPRLVKVARDIRTGMAAQPSVTASANPAMRPVMTNGHGIGHRAPMSAMARR